MPFYQHFNRQVQTYKKTDDYKSTHNILEIVKTKGYIFKEGNPHFLAKNEIFYCGPFGCSIKLDVCG